MKVEPREHEKGRADEVAPEEIKDQATETDAVEALTESEEAPEVLEEDSEEVEEDVEDEAEPAKGGKKPKEDAVQVKVSKKVLWSGIITAVVVLLGLGAWYFGWYQKAMDYYNAASISIKVREGETFVIEGASVLINGKSYTTDSNGKIVIDSIVAGSYQVAVAKDGYFPLDESLEIKRGDNDLKVYSLNKLPAKLYSAKGFVFDYVSEMPLADVQVTLGTKSVRTAPSGEYSFDKLVPGTYKTSVVRSGYINQDVNVEITDADAVNPEVKLVPIGQVIFVSNRDGKRALYSSNYDGTDQQKLVEPQNSGEDYAPVMSPDGKWVAFSSTREGTKSNYGSSLAKLYIVSRDGKELRKVNDDVSHSELKWSSTSRFIYYSAYTDKALTQFVRRVYDVSRKTTVDFSENIGSVQFSPNGTQLAYAYQVQVALPTPTPTPSPDPSASPIPTPTPTPTIQYEWRSRVSSIDLVTGERKQLADKAASFIDRLSYSPDGGTVYFEASIDNQRKRYQHLLKTGEEAEISLPSTPDTRSYVLSPSGTSKVFVESRDGKGDVFMVNANGTNEKRLTSFGLANANYVPVWDAAGGYVLFTVSRQGESAYYIVATSGGTQKKVVDMLADNNTADYYGQ